MLKQGDFLGFLLTWLLLPQFIQPSPPSTCDSCGDNCWKCIGGTQVPNHLGNDLEILYLSDNTLGSVTRESFSTYGNIRELYLNNCSLKHIPDDTFWDLKELELVDLSHNKFSEGLPETAFWANRNLQEVILSYNNFSRIKKHFLSSKSINILHLIGNNITEVSSESFELLPRLQELHLEKNRLKVLPPDLFTSLRYFSQLFIDHSTLVANVPFQSCIPGLIVRAGEAIQYCGAYKSEISTFTTGGNHRFVTNHTVTPSITQSPKKETQNLKTTNDIKHTPRTTSGFSTSVPKQLSTGGKEYPTESSELTTPITTGEPTLTFPYDLVAIKIMYLLLITASILLLTLILYITVKHCSCPSSHSSHTQQQYEDHPYYYAVNNPLLPSTEIYDHYRSLNGPTKICSLCRSSYGPAPVHASRRPASMASQYSDHTYQDIVYNHPNMVSQ